MKTQTGNLPSGRATGRRMLNASAGSFAVKAAGAAISFVIQVWLARLLNILEYGIYVYVLACANFAHTFTRIGFDVVVLRYIPAYRATKAWGSFQGLLRFSYRLVSGVSIAVASVAAASIWFLLDSSGDNTKHSLLLAAALIPILSLTTLRVSILQALNHAILAQIPDSILRPLLLGAIATTMYVMFGDRLSSLDAILANLIAAFVAFALGTMLLIRRMPAEREIAEPTYAWREWLKMGLPMLFMAGMSTIQAQAGTILLGTIAGAESAGLFGAVSKVAGLVVFGLGAVNAVVAPMISELYATGNKRRLQHAMTVAARIVFGFTAVSSSVLVLYGAEVLRLFGSEFSSGYDALIILLAGQTVSALSGSVGFLMVLTGHQRTALNVLVFSAISNLVLNAALIPLYGVVGSAIASAASTITWNLIMLYFVQTRVGINSTVIARLADE